MAREYTVKINVQSEAAAQKIEQFSAKALANIERINKVEIKPKTNTKDVEVSLNRVQEASIRATTAETNRAATAERVSGTIARAHATEVAALQKTRQKELDLEKATVQANGRLELQQMRMQQGQSAMNAFANATQNAVNQLKMLVGYAGATQMLRSALTEMKAMSDEMVTYQKVTGATAEQMKQVRADAYKSAKQYGQSPSDYLSSVAMMARAGYGQQSEAMANLATKTQLVGDMSAEMASKFLIAVDAGYQLHGNIQELEKVLNAANVADNNYATSLSQIAEGMTLVAPLAASMNVSVEETTAAIGTMQALTQRSGTEVARAFRMIAINIAKDTETEVEEGFKLTQENVEDFNALLQEFASEELKAANAAGKLLNPMKAIGAMAKAWKTGALNEQQLFNVLNNIGGARYTNSIMALVKNFDVYEEMVGKFATDLTSADDEVAAMMDSWNAKLKVLKTTWTEMVNNRVSEDFIKSLLDMGTGFLDWTGNLENFIMVSGGAVKAISALNAGLTSLAAGKGFGVTNGWTLGISALATAIGVAGSLTQQYNQKLNDQAKSAAETAQQSHDLARDLDDLSKAYDKIAQDGVIDESELEEAKRIQEEWDRLVGSTSLSYETLTTKIDAAKEAISKARDEQQKMSLEAANTAVADAESALIGLANPWYSGIDLTGRSGPFISLARYGLGSDAQKRRKEEADYIGKYLEGTLFEYATTLGADSAFLKFTGDSKNVDDLVRAFEELTKLKDIIANDYSGKQLPLIYSAVAGGLEELGSAIANVISARSNRDAIQSGKYSTSSEGTSDGSSGGSAGTGSSTDKGIATNDAYAKSYERLQAAIDAATTAQENFNAEIKQTKADGMKFYGSALEVLQGEMKAGRVNSTAFHAAAKALLGEEAYDKTGGYTQNVQEALFGKTGSSGMSLVDAITTLTAEYKNQAGEVREGAGLAVLLEKLGYNVRDEKGNYAVHMTEQMYKEVMDKIPGLTREILENTANAYDQYDKLGRNTGWDPEKDKQEQKTPEQELTDATTKTGETMEAASQTVETAASTVDTAADKVAAAADSVVEAVNGAPKKSGGNFVSSVQKAAVSAYKERAEAEESAISAWKQYQDQRKLAKENARIQAIKDREASGAGLDVAEEILLKQNEAGLYGTVPKHIFRSKMSKAAQAVKDELENQKAILRVRTSAVPMPSETIDPTASLYGVTGVGAGQSTGIDRDAAHEAYVAGKRAKRLARDVSADEQRRMQLEARASQNAKSALEAAREKRDSGQGLDIEDEIALKRAGEPQRPGSTERDLAHERAIDAQRAKRLAADAAAESARAEKLKIRAAEKAAATDPGYQHAQTTKNVDALLDELTGTGASATTQTEKPGAGIAVSSDFIGPVLPGTTVTSSREEQEEEYSFLDLQKADKAARTEASRQDAKAQAAQNAKAVEETARATSEINDKVQNLQSDVGAIQEDVHESPTREEMRNDFVKQLKEKGGSAFGGDAKSSALYQQGILAGDQRLQEKAIDMHIDNVINGIDTSALDKDFSPDDLTLGLHAILDDYSVDEAVGALNYLSDEAKPIYIKVLLDHYSLSEVLSNLDRATSQDRVTVIKAAIDKYGAQTVASEISKLSEGKKAMIYASLDPGTYATVVAALNELGTPITKTINVEYNERQIPAGISANDVYISRTGNQVFMPYATGTKYHMGGPAIVNDGTGAELIMDSSGAHIANGGREALIDLERGAKVYTAEQTRALLSGVPKFSTGSEAEAGHRAQGFIDAFDAISTNDTSYTTTENKSSGGNSGGKNNSADSEGSGGGGSSKEKDDSWDKIKTLIEYILTRLNKALEAQEELIDKQIAEINEQRQRAQQQDELGELQKRVSEARKNLADAENNRIVNYIDENGQWHWMADQKKVQQAKEELSDAQKSLQDFMTDMVIDAQIKVLESEKTRLEEEYGGYTDLWSDILDAVETPIEGLEGLLSAVASGPDAALSAGAKAVRDNLIQSLLRGSYKQNYEEAAGEIANAAIGKFNVPGKTDEMLAALIASSGASLNGAPLSYLGALQSIAGSMPIAGTTLSENLTNNNGNTYIINGVTLGSEIEDMPLSQILMALSVYTNTIY